MVHHVWTILCEEILANPKNNALSYINSIHESTLKAGIEDGKLVNIDPFIVATKWFKSPGKKETIELKVSVRHADSKETEVLTETKVDFTAKTYALALSIEINTLPIKQEGLHLILVEYKPLKNKKWKHGSTSPILILSKKDDAAPKD